MLFINKNNETCIDKSTIINQDYEIELPLVVARWIIVVSETFFTLWVGSKAFQHLLQHLLDIFDSLKEIVFLFWI